MFASCGAIDVEIKTGFCCNLLYGFRKVGVYCLIRGWVVGIVVIKCQSRAIIPARTSVKLPPLVGVRSVGFTSLFLVFLLH